MPEIVVSLQNRRVKQAIKLRDRRGRDKQGRMIVDGIREIRRAIEAKLKWSETFVCDDVRQRDVAPIVKELEAGGAEVVHVSPQVFAKLAYGERSEGIVAVAHTPMRTLANLTLPPAPVIAVLEAIEKPGNVGAVLRSADGAGVSAVLLANPLADLFNPNTIRASQGCIFTMLTAAATTSEIIAWLRERQFAMFTARVDATLPYTAAVFQPKCAIVLGSEATGLSDAWTGEDITGIRLPMQGSVDSLNVSVTAGVLFYEALRQRGVDER